MRTLLRGAVQPIAEIAKAGNDVLLVVEETIDDRRVDRRVGVALLDEALTLFRDIGDAWGTSHALRRLGMLLTFDGQYARARPLVEEALAGARAAGDKNALAWAGALTSTTSRRTR